MKQPSLRFGALIGLMTAIPVIAISYLANTFIAQLPFLPFDVFDWLTRVLPGPLVTFGIDAMVSMLRALGLSVSETAKLAEQIMALTIIVLLGAFVGLFVAGLMRWLRLRPGRASLLSALPLFILLLIVDLTLGQVATLPAVVLWLAFLTVAWTYTIAALLVSARRESAEDSSTAESTFDPSRRDILLKLSGAVVGLTLGAWGLSRVATTNRDAAANSGAAQPLPTSPPASGDGQLATSGAEIPPTPQGRISPAPGTRAEITSNEDFYRIDINTRPPVIDGQEWQLQIEGLFRSPRNLTISELMDFPAVTQPITLSCISNRVAGDLIGTSYWTGLRLRDLLSELQLTSEAGALFVEARDGFYETISAADMMDERTLLVYGMNGQTLPVEHGFPLRIFVPNRYGMKQPKWIERITAIEAWRPGYWVERGWSVEARPQIVSVIDAIATESAQDGLVPVGGIAWAGDRGIERVEVRIDDGPWQPAQLRTPPISNLTWVQWRYDWPAEPGRHTVTVRATDGAGELQTDAINDPHPDGATGYHSRTITV